MSEREKRVTPKRRITIDDAGVSLFDPQTQRSLWRIEWSAVKEIAAWKDDVFSYDIICMGFRTTDAEEYRVCDEKYQGWEELVKKIEQVFPDISSDWWSRVAYPAFAENWTVVWGSLPHAADRRPNPLAGARRRE